MATTVNMHEAKTNFSKLAKLVEQGEEVVIARNGIRIMKLVAIEHELVVPRDLSKLSGLIDGPVSQDEWDLLDEEILALTKSEDDF